MSAVYVDEKSAWRAPLGILLIAYEEEKGLPTSILMVVALANSSAIGVFAPLAQFLCTLITTRLLMCLNGLFLCACFAIASFFLTELAIILILGLLIGFGLALGFCPSVVMTNLCFEKRRAAAVGICFSGASVGSMVMPILVTFLLEHYYVEGCLLILGAIMMNFCVAAAIFPTEIRKRDNDCEEVILSEKLFCLSSSTDGNSTSKRKQPISVNSRRDNSLIGTCKRFLVYFVIVLLSHFAYTTQFYGYPLYANEFNFGRYFIASTLTVQGVTDLVFRFFSGFFIDRLTDAEKSLTVGISILLQGIAALILTWFMSSQLSMVYSAIFGISGALFMTLWSVVLLSIVGSKRFPVFLSTSYLSSGLFNLPLGFLLGQLRDFQGTFRLAIQICGMALAFSGLLTICIIFPCFRKFAYRYSKSKDRSRKCNDAEIALTSMKRDKFSKR